MKAVGAGAGGGSANRGPGKAGEVQDSSPRLKPAQAEVEMDGRTIRTTAVINRVFDDFRQFEFADAKTGKTVRYNLFVPRNMQPGVRHPLVLFMHDAGVTGTITTAPLYQGNGAIAWATPESQAKHPCFVLAPAYDEIIADDDSKTSSYLDATLNLIRALASQHPIDSARRYATGQSGGGMMSIAMNIRYPDFFAASYLVACQWDPKLVGPMARNRLWITVSEDDAKAFPGQTAIVNRLQGDGARVVRGTWDAQWSPRQFREAFEKMDAQQANVNFVAFARGTVFRPGESTAGASGHMATWRHAYGIEPVRDWIFRQHR